MRTLEVRRHALTKKGPARASGSSLSAEGVRRAREAGSQLSDVEYVATGPERRHLETAIAMGFAVDETAAWPSGYVLGVVEHHDQWRWERPFERYAHLLRRHESLREVAAAHLTRWLGALDEVGPSGTALVISSGGSIEPVLVAASPNSGHAAWGGALHHLQGATLTFDGHRCVDVTMRR